MHKFVQPLYTLRDLQGGSTFVKDTVDMGDYLREFEHTFMFDSYSIVKRLAPFEVLPLKNVNRCMISLNFFIKTLTLRLSKQSGTLKALTLLMKF